MTREVAMTHSGWLLGAVLLVQQTAAPQLAVPVEPATAIVDALRSHDVVAMGAGHGEERGYALGLSLVRDPRFVAVVNDIVIEEANVSSRTRRHHGQVQGFDSTHPRCGNLGLRRINGRAFPSS